MDSQNKRRRKRKVRAKRKRNKLMITKTINNNIRKIGNSLFLMKKLKVCKHKNVLKSKFKEVIKNRMLKKESLFLKVLKNQIHYFMINRPNRN